MRLQTSAFPSISSSINEWWIHTEQQFTSLLKNPAQNYPTPPQETVLTLPGIYTLLMLWATSFHRETFPCILVSLANQHAWAKFLPTEEEECSCKLERGGWMSLNVSASTQSPQPAPTSLPRHFSSKELQQELLYVPLRINLTQNN